MLKNQAFNIQENDAGAQKQASKAHRNQHLKSATTKMEMSCMGTGGVDKIYISKKETPLLLVSGAMSEKNFPLLRIVLT